MNKFAKNAFYSNIRLPMHIATTMNPVAYKNAKFFKTEMKQVFDKGWTCVGITQQAQSHGDTFMANITNKPIIITREKSGNLNGFFNTCRHRAHTVVQKDGKYPVFTCPYHKWSYKLNGDLHKTPLFFDGTCPKYFDKKDNGLFPLRVETVGNMIFATDDENIPSINELTGDLGEKLEPYNLQDLILLKQKDYTINSNWKLLQENFMEYLHLPSIHPSLTTISKVEDHSRYQGPGQYVGFITKPLTNSGTPCDVDYLKSIPNLPEFNSDMALFNQIFPNVFYFLFPSHIFIVVSFPLSPEKTLEKTFLLGSREIAMEETKVQELLDFYDLTNLEDIEACEKIMVGLNCERFKGGKMSLKYEETIHRFQNIFADHMTGYNFNIPEGDEEENVYNL